MRRAGSAIVLTALMLLAFAPLRAEAGNVGYAPFTSWSALVKRQYVDLTTKAPTSAQSSSWVSQLSAQTKTKGDLIDALRRGPENLANVDPVVRVYRAFLGRAPDAGGLQFWIKRKRNVAPAKTWSVTQIATEFTSSNEFKTKYGSLTNRQFVTQIYTDVLGRAADPSGVSYWTGKLDRKERTKAQIVVGFSESNEYKRKQLENTDVAVAYIYLVGRAPTTAEANDWTTRQKTGTSHATLAKELLETTAYANHIKPPTVSGSVSRVVAGNDNTYLIGASGDGAVVLFGTDATNIGTGGPGMYVRASNGSLTRLGTPSAGEVSDNGRYVAYQGPSQTVYRLDRQTNTTATVIGDDAPGYVFGVDVADDGTVAVTTDNKLSPLDTTTDIDVYLWRTSGSVRVPHLSGVELVSPVISGDGSWVVFQVSPAGTTDLYAANTSGGSASRLTTGNGISEYPSISYDGRWVAFESDATNLVPGGTTADADYNVYRVDRTTKAVSVVARADESSFSPSISADGQQVAFSSRAFGAGDHSQLFRWTAGTGTVIKLTDGNADSNGALSIAGDGRSVVFESYATDLIAGDTNGEKDVFRWSV